MTLWHRAFKRPAGVIVTIAALVVLLPFGATAAQPQAATFDTFLSTLGQPLIVTELNSDRVRVELNGTGFSGSVDPDSEIAHMFTGDADGDVVMTYDVDRMNGTVMGTLIVNANQTEPNFFWEGKFRGHLTPAGASGAIRMNEMSGTELRFSGTWTTNGPIDPMDEETAFPLWVTGMVIGEVPT